MKFPDRTCMGQASSGPERTPFLQESPPPDFPKTSLTLLTVGETRTASRNKTPDPRSGNGRFALARPPCPPYAHESLNEDRCCGCEE